MNILFISQYFYPENFKGNDLIFGLIKQGHKVLVITGKPNYPKGDFYDGYGYFNKSREEINGVAVIRLPIIPRKKGKIWLGLNYISFYVSAIVFFLFGKLSFKFDVILTQQLSPVTSSFPGLWYKNKFKKPLITWVLDLWPDSLTANSNIKKGIIINYLEKKVKHLYLNSDTLLVSSKAFEKAIKAKIGENTPIVQFPNWAEEIFTKDKVHAKEFQNLPEGFNIVFAGNFGEAQDFESILMCINELKEVKGINWNFVGNGRYKEALLKMISEYQLTNVYIYPMHSVNYMPSLFAKADAMLLSLRGGSLISETVPAKLQTYMSSGKIILAMIDGETKEIIENAKCGLVCDAGDYKSLAKNVLQIIDKTEEERIQMCQNSFDYYNINFSRKILFEKFEDVIKRLG